MTRSFTVRDPFIAGVELLIDKAPIPVEEFLKHSSFVTLARAVEEGYAFIDKDLIIKLPEDDDGIA